MAEVRKHQDAILKDLILLEAKPIFSYTHHTKNVQEFLTQHISWQGGDFKPLETPNHNKLEKFKNLIYWNNPDQLQNLLAEKEIMLMNLSWMNELLNYDHLNFSSHSKIKSQMQLAAQSGSLQRIAIMTELPMPELNELRQFAVIYFLQQYQKGNTKQGLLVLEHVAKILHSENTLVSQMLVVALLRTENKLKNYLNFSEPTLASEETILAYRRLSWAWNGISLLPWANADISVFEPYLKRQNGICSAVGEPVNLDRMKDFFEPHFLFENDMSLNFKNLRFYQNKLRTLCQAQHMKIFDQPVKAENNKLLLHLPSSILSVDDEALSMWPLNWARIPFVR